MKEEKEILKGTTTNFDNLFFVTQRKIDGFLWLQTDCGSWIKFNSFKKFEIKDCSDWGEKELSWAGYATTEDNKHYRMTPKTKNPEKAQEFLDLFFK